MKVIFLAKDKESSCKALEFLLDNKIEIVCAVISNESKKIKEICLKNRIKTFNEITIYEEIAKNESLNADLVISFLFWKKIKKDILNKYKCINFHPAPLPEYRGVGGYNFAVLDNIDYWGVSSHYVDENIDTGKIIKVKKFSIEKNISAFELEKISQKKLLELFKEIILLFKDNKEIKTIEQTDGKYISKNILESQKEIKSNDSNEEIDKKIRAFWFPPYIGAYIVINDKKYTLINEEMLEKISLFENDNI